MRREKSEHALKSLSRLVAPGKIMVELRVQKQLHLPERSASVVALLLKPFILGDLMESLEINPRVSLFYFGVTRRKWYLDFFFFFF